MPAALSNLDRTYELDIGDLERVAAIDRSLSGRSRRHFFETRLAAAREHPDRFIQIGARRGGMLRGFAFARILSGEFGRKQAVGLLDVIGVEPHSQRIGIGRELMENLLVCARERGVVSLQSQAAWTNHSLLRFFVTSGFRLAPRTALKRSVTEPLSEVNEDV